MNSIQKRHRNHGLRKLCGCARRQWPKCAHSWYFNFKVPGGEAYSFSIDREVGHHVQGKSEAEELAEGWRPLMRAGTFRRRTETPPAEATPTPAAAVTLSGFTKMYEERRAALGVPITTNDESCLRKFVEFDGLGAKAFDAITTDDAELFFAHLRQKGAAASTRNKYVQAIKAMFRWAVKKGHLQRDPIDPDAVKRARHAKRDRRLAPDVLDKDGKLQTEGEERRLLAVSGPHLQRLVVGALESCCRLGELLSLTWADVNLTRKELTIRAENAKTRTARTLPISTRLSAVLEMAWTALDTKLREAEGEKVSAEDHQRAMARCYVFGDSIGHQVSSLKRTWATAVLKAHAHTPQWSKVGNKLKPESRAALRAIDLHFHDLRHEGGSRLLEAGWPIHHVQHMLGHANLSQTSTYLNATKAGLQDSMRRFDDSRCNPVVKDAETDRPLVYNEQPASDSKLSVN